MACNYELCYSCDCSVFEEFGYLCWAKQMDLTQLTHPVESCEEFEANYNLNLLPSPPDWDLPF